jgi:hypothetical protein
VVALVSSSPEVAARVPSNENVSVTPQVFASTFREVIRVGLNWDRFFLEAWPIDVVELRSDNELARCFMPWYIGKTGQEVAYDDKEAVPMRLTDVPNALKLLNNERKGDLNEYVEMYRTQRCSVEFIAPTYSLPDDQYFLLDRNHRLSALTLAPVPFQVTLWNVRGPLDPDGLLDLIHWTRKSR